MWSAVTESRQRCSSSAGVLYWGVAGIVYRVCSNDAWDFLRSASGDMILYLIREFWKLSPIVLRSSLAFLESAWLVLYSRIQINRTHLWKTRIVGHVSWWSTTYCEATAGTERLTSRPLTTSNQSRFPLQLPNCKFYNTTCGQCR
jgi:hypothetical protein